MVRSPLTTMQYVMYFCLFITGEAKATSTGRILKVTHQGAEPGAKSDVCDCVVPPVTLNFDQ